MAKKNPNRAPAHIKHYGEPQTARTLNRGLVVTRQDKLWVREWSALVPCTPYDDHFIYANPEGGPGTSAFLCTCGAAAVVANHADTRARMFVCQMHVTTGKHATSFVNRRSFEKDAGEVIKV